MTQDTPPNTAASRGVEVLPDPNHPAYEAARWEVARYMFAIQRSEPGSGYGRMADELMCGDLMEIPTWVALGIIARHRLSQPQSSDVEAIARRLIREQRKRCGHQKFHAGYDAAIRAFANALAALPNPDAPPQADGTDAVRRAALEEALAGFIADLTDAGRNRGTCLSVNHDALNARIKQARRALAAGEPS